jgi:hypothetical protein
LVDALGEESCQRPGGAHPEAENQGLFALIPAAEGFAENELEFRVAQIFPVLLSVPVAGNLLQ